MGCLIPNSSQPESWDGAYPSFMARECAIILRDMLRCNEIKFGMCWWV